MPLAYDVLLRMRILGLLRLRHSKQEEKQSREQLCFAYLLFCKFCFLCIRLKIVTSGTSFRPKPWKLSHNRSQCLHCARRIDP